MKDSLTFQTDFWDERLYFVFCPENWTLVGTGCKTSLNDCSQKRCSEKTTNYFWF